IAATRLLSNLIFQDIKNPFWNFDTYCHNQHILSTENLHPEVIGRIMEETPVLHRKWSKNMNWQLAVSRTGQLGMVGRQKPLPMNYWNLVFMHPYYIMALTGKEERLKLLKVDEMVMWIMVSSPIPLEKPPQATTSENI